MQHVRFEDIEERHIRSIVANGDEETLTLEFKRELDLSTNAKKKEAAKDVSAMANAAGGRILYGVDEGSVRGGRKVASALTPLTSASVEEQLNNVIHSAIHPRTLTRTKKLELSGSPGQFVLIAEVPPSVGIDLHMVSAYGDRRFYRRGEKGVLPMTEPEVREAYSRIASLQANLDERLEDAIVNVTENSDSSQDIVILPWYERHNLIDPRRLRNLGTELREADLCPRFENLLSRLSVRYDGIYGRSESHWIDLEVRRKGSIRLGRRPDYDAFRGVAEVRADEIITNILVALQVARHILERVGYVGPVRIVNLLKMRSPWRFKETAPGQPILPGQPLEGGESADYRQIVPGEILLEGHVERITRELLDQVAQVFGLFECSLFNGDGKLKDDLRRNLSARLPKPHRP